ncbi:unnamed protein product [Malus baccata var. baccata]
MSKIISQSETTASRYDAGASSMEWRPLIAIDANVQMQNPKDEAMFDETTMVDDDEVMAKSKATVQPKPSWFDDDDYIVQSLNDEVMGKSKATLKPKPSWFDDDDDYIGQNCGEVCCEEVEDHKSHNCPYFVLVPKGARVGKHCDIVCIECDEQVSEHEGELRIHEFLAPAVAAGMGKTNNRPTIYVDYEGRAILKYCDWCENYCSHWTEECESMPK